MKFRKECKERGCAFCDRDRDRGGDYYGRDGYVYGVCYRCREILNDILTHRGMDMENRFNHLEPLELIKKLPSLHQMMFAYGTVYAMDDVKGEGVIPMVSDNATVNDAAMIFAYQNFPNYAEQRAWVLEKYKILEDHRLGQDKEHLRKKLEETRKECEKIEKRIAELEEEQ